MNEPTERIALEILIAKNREEAGTTYARIVHAIQGTVIDPGYDVASVNRTILNRWSRSGLEHIKRIAWKKWGSETGRANA